MSDAFDVLFGLRDLDIPPGHDYENQGSARVRAALEREIAGEARSDRRRWSQRRIRVGGVALTPAVVLAVVASAAAATAVAFSGFGAKHLFRANPQNPPGARVTQHVVPSSVSNVASAEVPGLGKVEYWAAYTAEGGTCWAIKLPDGAWGGPKPSQEWVGGSLPGCGPTRQQQITSEPSVKPGQKPSADNGQLLAPTAVETWNAVVRNKAGQKWNLDFGFVETQRKAVTVRDPDTGATAPVQANGYYLLVSRQDGDLQALSATGTVLKPDYTWGHLLPGYRPGPTS